jgi:hypothetical protein
LAVLWRSAAPAQAADPSPDRALVLLAPGADVNSVVHALERIGGHATHVFPPAALIGKVPPGVPPMDGVVSVHRQAVDAASLAALPGDARRAAELWNAMLAPPPPSDETLSASELEAELVGDALVAPMPPVALQSSDADPTPGYFETSQYLVGRVAVGIVLPESSGGVDPSTENWTADERALVRRELIAALDWWAARQPNAHLTFVYDDGTAAPIATAYEPIGRRYSDQSLWIAEVMARKGYVDNSYFNQVRAYNNALRNAHHTDWAFTIFVVDSSSDGDNRFSDGYFAYAYLGGPFTVLTYGNNGYGPENMDAVAAHEIGHIFMALDQYYGAHMACTYRSGYLGVENQNSQYGGCGSNATSIMRGQIWPYREGAIDQYARGQLGWRDSDGDGILDPMDTTLSVVESGYVVDQQRPNVLIFTGRVRDNPYPSPLQRSTLINTIERVEYRTGGDWIASEPADGAFDSHTEDFTFITPPLPTGVSGVELQVIDSAGNRLVQTLASVAVVDPVDDILATTLTRLDQDSQGDEATQVAYRGQAVSWSNIVAEAYYRIDDAAWQPLLPEDGAFDEPQEDFAFSIDPATLDPGVHQVQAYAVDSQGNVETSPASDSLFVTAHVRYTFMPVMMGPR